MLNDARKRLGGCVAESNAMLKLGAGHQCRAKIKVGDKGVGRLQGRGEQILKA